ncbi:putative lipoprotein [Desulfovibrio sp. X2]|uniref:hypothetical protein n=1 Tax=Desulfovibrio sp. X2 TaxID=941449 RepID=UPI000358BFC5|nr:hypothetical protein [Desulfovibrio sp. X2]EPR44016.1 putative lipoprotein [Desulfovibrio sp. X2]
MHKCRIWLTLAVLVLGLSACSMKSADLGSGPGSGTDSGGKAEDVNYYYDFDDILIYKDLTYDVKDSTVIESPDFKIGFQVFNGRVENLSLVNFFLENMAKDGWKNIYVMKSKSSELIFEKPRERCTIRVIDENFANTRVEIQAVKIKVGGSDNMGSSMNSGGMGMSSKPKTSGGSSTIYSAPQVRNLSQ